MEKHKAIIDAPQPQNRESLEGAFWQWQSGPNPDPWAEKDPVKRTWQDYSDNDCLIIEEAFLLKKEFADLGNYEIDFKRMVQVNKKFRDRMRRVRRQERSRFMMEICEPIVVGKDQKMAFGTVQQFLEGLMKKAPVAYALEKRLKVLSLDSKNNEFEDIIKQVVLCIEKGSEFRQKTIKTKSNLIPEAKKIISRIGDGSATLGDFLRTILKIYTAENFLCDWLNQLLRSEDWEGINLLTPFIVCLVETFKRPEYIIKYQEPQGLMKSLRGIVGKQKISFYKGAALSKEQFELYDPKKIKRFSWKGITSVSRDENFALNFMRSSLKKAQSKVGVFFRIEGIFASPEDYEGIIDLLQNSLGQCPDEQEVILAPGTVFKLRKVREIEKDIYEVSLKIKKKFEETKENNIASMTSLQQERVILEGLPSQQSLRLLEHLKVSKTIRKLEIKNSGIEDNIMEEIERIRGTTNLKKEDIKLKDNVIAVSSLGSLVYYFSEEKLNDIFLSNKIRFIEGGVIKNKEALQNFVLSEEILNKFKQNNQLKDLAEKMKDENQLKNLDLSIPKILNLNDEFIEFVECIKEIKSLQSLTLKINQKQTLSKEYLGVLCETMGSSSTLNKLSLELISSNEGLSVLGKTLGAMKSLEELSLNLTGSNEISDEGLNHLKNGLIELTSLNQLSLNFTSCRKISDQGLGHIKDAIISLPALQKLSLDFNECGKASNEGLNHLKSGLILLTSLQHLSLSFEKCTKISDEGINHLTSGIGSLIALQHLSLNFTGCTEILDKGLDHVKKTLVLLKSLEHLSLNFTGCNEISDQGLNHLKNGLITFTSLKHLSLYFSECNDISDKGLHYLKDGLILLTDLQHLSLHFHLCRKISNNGLNSIKESLLLLTSLQHLSLEFSGRNSISDEGLSHLKSSLFSLKSLQQLSLDFSWCNKISDEGLKHLGEGLMSLPSLQYLSLNFKKSDKLYDEGLNQLLNGLLSLKSLRHLSLDFSWCTRISDEGLYLLKSVLASFTSLQHLSLDFSGCNKISDDGLNHLKNGLVSLTSVRHLSFDFSWCHHISDEGLKYLKDGLVSLTDLQYLSLDFNDCNISDEGLNYLKSALVSLRSLQHLFMYFSECPKISVRELDKVYEQLSFVSELVCNK